MTECRREDTVRLEHPLVAGTEVPRERLWDFPEGLIGLPDFKRFALVPLEGFEPFELLCSVDDVTLGFVLVDPGILVPDYSLGLAPADLAPIPADELPAIQVRVPVVLPSGEQPLKLNLKGPLVLAPRILTGVQRISPDESHPLQFVPDLTGSGAR